MVCRMPGCQNRQHWHVKNAAYCSLVLRFPTTRDTLTCASSPLLVIHFDISFRHFPRSFTPQSIGPSLMLDNFFENQWVYYLGPPAGTMAAVVIIWVTAPSHDGGALKAFSKFPVQVPDWIAEDNRDSRLRQNADE